MSRAVPINPFVRNTIMELVGELAELASYKDMDCALLIMRNLAQAMDVKPEVNAKFASVMAELERLVSA